MLPGLGLGGLATVARLVQTPMGWPLPALGDRAARSWALPPDISFMCLLRFFLKSGTSYVLLLSHHAKLNQDPLGDFFLADVCVFGRGCRSGDQGVTNGEHALCQQLPSH